MRGVAIDSRFSYKCLRSSVPKQMLVSLPPSIDFIRVNILSNGVWPNSSVMVYALWFGGKSKLLKAYVQVKCMLWCWQASNSVIESSYCSLSTIGAVFMKLKCVCRCLKLCCRPPTYSAILTKSSNYWISTVSWMRLCPLGLPWKELIPEMPYSLTLPLLTCFS